MVPNGGETLDLPDLGGVTFDFPDLGGLNLELGEAGEEQRREMQIVARGSNPKCQLCRGGGYPRDPGHVINMLYIGQGTCRMYHKAGLQGNIPNHLCTPLQVFAKGPCNCPNGGGTSNQSKNNQKWSNTRGGAGNGA